MLDPSMKEAFLCQAMSSGMDYTGLIAFFVNSIFYNDRDDSEAVKARTLKYRSKWVIIVKSGEEQE